MTLLYQTINSRQISHTGFQPPCWQEQNVRFIQHPNWHLYDGIPNIGKVAQIRPCGFEDCQIMKPMNVHIHASTTLSPEHMWERPKWKISVRVVNTVSVINIGDEKSLFLHILMEKIPDWTCVLYRYIFHLFSFMFSSWVFFSLYFRWILH